MKRLHEGFQKTNHHVPELLRQIALTAALHGLKPDAKPVAKPAGQ